MICYLYDNYMKYVCWGGEMIKEKETEKIINIKCRACRLSNTELKGLIIINGFNWLLYLFLNI